MHSVQDHQITNDNFVFVVRCSWQPFAIMAQSTSLSQLNMRKFTIKKLLDTNYRIWKARLELVLFKYNKVWDIILGSSTKPEKGDELEEFEEKDLCARMKILMHVSYGTGETLRKMETAQEKWKHLQTI